MANIIGAWKITTASGETWYSDRFDGETIEDAIADAIATFGDGVVVEMA